ncbi:MULTISPECIES: acyltransferase family protein [Dyella]|uniref:Acyltransferase n=2 Tax=Dyella TaxID=231454 RepID=A0A4R0YG39_9GAMM|nr:MULTISPECIES: acyltransferase [Dyella]TBR36217.1 acyltransferase [Dyella terrae]TCI05874.1 acyltransferase [Dyella soli]
MRLPGLDLLRAIAIVWVMLFHSYIVGGIGDHLGGAQWYGWMGVDLFFVLSGYLIGTQLLRPLARGEGLRFGEFYRRRAYRILPAFIVVLALYALWPAWREVPGMQPLWQFPTFTFNLLFANGENVAFSHVWSLCVEEHFYLVFPLAAWLVMRRPSTARFAVLCSLIVLGGMALRAWIWVNVFHPAQLADDGTSGLAFLRYIYYPTYSRLDGLLAGVVLAACAVFRPTWMARIQRHGHAVLVLGLVLFGVSVAIFAERAGFAATVVGYPLMSLALMCMVAAASGGNSVLARVRVPGAGWLAAISYSLYLCHKGVFHLVQVHAADTFHGWTLFGIYALATLAGGALLHYAIERPFLRWRDSRRRPVLQPATAVGEAA